MQSSFLFMTHLAPRRKALEVEYLGTLPVERVRTPLLKDSPMPENVLTLNGRLF
jgi:hypothetical protein